LYFLLRISGSKDLNFYSNDREQRAWVVITASFSISQGLS